MNWTVFNQPLAMQRQNKRDGTAMRSRILHYGWWVACSIFAKVHALSLSAIKAYPGEVSIIDKIHPNRRSEEISTQPPTAQVWNLGMSPAVGVRAGSTSQSVGLSATCVWLSCHVVDVVVVAYAEMTC